MSLKVGDRVRLNWEGHASHGTTGTISEVGHGSAGVMFDGVAWDRWYAFERLIPITEEPEQPESPEHTIAELTNALHEVSLDKDRLQKIADELRSDLGHFESVMRDQKTEQGWCDEGTNQVISELNGGFTRWQIEPYEQEFEIDVNIDIYISTSYRITVMATSEEAAYDYFNDSPDSYIDDSLLNEIVNDELTYGNAEVTMSA